MNDELERTDQPAVKEEAEQAVNITRLLEEDRDFLQASPHGDRAPDVSVPDAFPSSDQLFAAADTRSEMEKVNEARGIARDLLGEKDLPKFEKLWSQMLKNDPNMKPHEFLAKLRESGDPRLISLAIQLEKPQMQGLLKAYVDWLRNKK